MVEGLRHYFPGCAVTTDIMTGFPGETDEEFSKTLDFVREIGFADAHIFKYSRRKGTPADAMPNQVPPEVKEIRSKKLSALCEKSRDEYLDRHLNMPLEVLFEDKNSGYYEGKTANYITVFVKSSVPLGGQYRTVIAYERRNGALYAALAD